MIGKIIKAVVVLLFTFAVLSLGISLGVEVGYSAGSEDGRASCVAEFEAKHLVSAKWRIYETFHRIIGYRFTGSNSDGGAHGAFSPTTHIRIRSRKLVWMGMDYGPSWNNGERGQIQSPSADGGILRLSAWHGSGSNKPSERTTYHSAYNGQRTSKTFKSPARSKRSSRDSFGLSQGRNCGRKRSRGVSSYGETCS
jgi:hypothetical protein